MNFIGNNELAAMHGLNNKNVDMHAHILPDFDDGAHDSKEMLEILKQMRETGTEALFWTPHLNLNPFPHINQESIEAYYEQYADLVQRETGIALFSGAELFCAPPLPEKRVPLGQSDFCLIEFPLDIYPRYLFEGIYNIQMAGYRVIMAHVERYRWLFPKKKKFLKTTVDYSLVDTLKNKNVYFQVNYTTLLNITEYPYMLPLLREKKIEFLGSDKHWLTDKRSVIDFETLSMMEF